MKEQRIKEVSLTKNGKCLLTDRRIIVMRQKGILKKRFERKDIPLDQISKAYLETLPNFGVTLHGFVAIDEPIRVLKLELKDYASERLPICKEDIQEFLFALYGVLKEQKL